MERCHTCGNRARRACARCGQFVCDEHVTAWHNVPGASVVCHPCARVSWVSGLGGTVVLIVAAWLLYHWMR